MYSSYYHITTLRHAHMAYFNGCMIMAFKCYTVGSKLIISYLYGIIGNSMDSNRMSIVSEVISINIVGEIVRSIKCSSGVGLVTGVLQFVQNVSGITVRSIREAVDVELIKETTEEFPLLPGKDVCEKLVSLALVLLQQRKPV